jgi:hypothetical protein
MGRLCNTSLELFGHKPVPAREIKLEATVVK